MYFRLRNMVGIHLNKQVTSVITLLKKQTIHDALFVMQKNNIKRIVIVENNIPVGIVTERDIGKFLEYDKTSRNLDEINLDEIMSRNLVTVYFEQSDIISQCPDLVSGR